MKVLPHTDGSDVALFTRTDANGKGLSLPSRVHYRPDGSLQIGEELK